MPPSTLSPRTLDRGGRVLVPHCHPPKLSKESVYSHREHETEVLNLRAHTACATEVLFPLKFTDLTEPEAWALTTISRPTSIFIRRLYLGQTILIIE